MTKYVLIQWPESQLLMDHERFNECLLVQDIDNHVEVGSSAYMCPYDLYKEIFDKRTEIDYSNELPEIEAHCYESGNPVSENPEDHSNCISLIYEEKENTPLIVAGDDVVFQVKTIKKLIKTELKL